jgi:hypothetical protein
MRTAPWFYVRVIETGGNIGTTKAMVPSLQTAVCRGLLFAVSQEVL